MSEQLTYSDEVQVLAELAKTIYYKWSATQKIGELKTPVGTISLGVRGHGISFDNKQYISADPVLQLEYIGMMDGKNYGWQVKKGNSGAYLDDAKQICFAITQYFASEDFQKKRADSIAQLKRVTRAIKGE